MIKYTIHRILWLIPVLLCVVIIVFVLSQMMPGDPVVNKLGTYNYTQEQYDKVAADMGLDKPIVVQMFDYLKNLLTKGELGTSYNTNQDVSLSIENRLWVTVKLGVYSILVSVLISVPLGILAAVKQKTAADYTVTVFAVVLSSLPNFWIALEAIILFSLKLKLLPASGLDSWVFYILPVGCNALMSMATTMRLTRTSMLETIRQDYVRTARAKGLSERVVIFKHALRNALIPVVTVVGAMMGTVIGGSVIIESIFSIPGIGSLMVTAINNLDYPMIMGLTLVTSVFTCIMNLLVDLCYAAIDPRIRVQFAGGQEKKKGSKTELTKVGEKA